VGVIAVEHEHKAAVSWNSFRDRLGQSEYGDMASDLNDLIQTVELVDFDEPFTSNEIDALIKELPIDKASGPDGFNGMFIKNCWHLLVV
jgi:hypothetical protein